MKTTNISMYIPSGTIYRRAVTSALYGGIHGLSESVKSAPDRCHGLFVSLY